MVGTQTSLNYDKDNFEILQYIEYSGKDNNVRGIEEGTPSQRFAVKFSMTSEDPDFADQQWSFVVDNYDDEIVTLDKTSCVVSETGTSCFVGATVGKVTAGPLQFSEVVMTFDVSDPSEASVSSGDPANPSALSWAYNEIEEEVLFDGRS